jgi:4-hydroxy-3-polyprenylbenzoate decarboxylase
MKLVVAITGASGSLYAQRLLQILHDDAHRGAHEVHVALSAHAREVAAAEVGSLAIPDGFPVHSDNSMQVPYVSGSARFDAMVIVPCSMGTLGRIAHGYSDSAIARAADVFLKEKRKLILVPRETPWNLIQARNVVTLLEAGADIIPAIPSFYHRPQTVLDVVDTVVARILDHLGLEHPLGRRWMEPEGKGD